MKKLLEKLDNERASIERTRAWWEEHAERLEPVAAALDALGADIEICIGTDPDLTARLSGDAHKLTAAIRAMRTRGFATDAKPMEKGKTSWCTWFFHRDESAARIYFSFSSTVCRRVKVGERIVPEHKEDVYEVVCGEIEIDRSAENAKPAESAAQNLDELDKLLAVANAPAAGDPLDDIPF